MRDCRTALTVALAAFAVAGCRDTAPSGFAGLEAPEEVSRQLSHSRALKLGCTVEQDGETVACPGRLSVLGNLGWLPRTWHIDSLPPPRKPERLADENRWLLEATREILADPGHKGYPDDEVASFRWFLETKEAEDAMARAGCATMEDECADGVRTAIGWSGTRAPGWAALNAHEERKERDRLRRLEERKRE